MEPNGGDDIHAIEGAPLSGGGLRTTREKWLLAAKIALGVLAVLIVVALAWLRTWPPLLVVMSSSMQPTIDTGDVVLMQRLDRPPDVGDIVQVHPPQEIQDRLNYPDTVIHRIVAIRKGKVYTKGDARNQRDPFTVPADDVNAHEIAVIPGVGQIVAFFTSPLGLIWIVAGILLFIVLPYYELRRDQVEVEKAELGSLSTLRSEVHDLARAIEIVQGVGASSPPPPPPLVYSPADDELYDEYESGAERAPELESEAEGAAGVAEMRESLQELVGAVSDYGEHLASHTKVLKAMSGASQDLAETVARLRTLLADSALERSEPRLAARNARANDEAEAVLALWREQRAADIADWMGFHDPLDAARLARLDEAADDEGIERALKALAAEKPYLRG